MKLPYNGAGLALTWESPEGELYVALGKRSINPYKGTWSFPGGRKEPKDASFRITAAREFAEETSVNPTIEIQPSHLRPIFTRFFIVYNWRTFEHRITDSHKPALGFGSHQEFSQIRWFSTKDLPKPLHWGVKQALRTL